MSAQDLKLDDPRPVLVTGGAGFIGSNLAQRILDTHHPVILFDNLSRGSVERNAEWLKSRYGGLVELVRGDVRDPASVKDVVKRCSRVFHFAAQVAVTTSLDDPTADFEINARGTLNVLEAIRAMPEAERPPILYTSTNKVYGALPDVEMKDVGARYEPANEVIRARGISEERPLDLHSPYGCSKGAADQYVLDYTRSFGLRGVVFRMSCIYGPRQFGTEDQGWLAHFLIRALEERTITLYGDGKQVRDVLFVGDLVDAMLLAQWHLDRCSGQAFNMGGGPENTSSLLELLDRITELRGGRRPETRFEGWRVGDQRYYVSDTRKFAELTGWRARVGVDEGLKRLHTWLSESVVRPRASGIANAANGANGAARAHEGATP